MPIFDLSMQRDAGAALTSALRMLGFRAVNGCPGQYVNDFTAKLKAGNMQFDLLKDFDALCGSVSHAYYQLDKAYPDAKFIFVDQDPEQWAKAMVANIRETANISAAIINSSKPELNLFAYERLLNLGCLHTEDESYLAYRYQLRKTAVLNYFNGADSGKLLVMKLTDGWDPLCKFLGRNVPTATFPVPAVPETPAASQ